MKQVIKYEAKDGAVFDSAEKCLEHEALIDEIDAVMSALPKKPNSDTCRFDNGHGYIQHSSADFLAAKNSLLRIANRIWPHKWFVSTIERPDERHHGYAGRLISEMAAPLYKAWYRISCTDKNYREWGQPYYAENPPSGAQCFQINK